MLSYKLVQLIQYHSDTLAADLLRQVRNSARAQSYCNVSPEDLKERVGEIYHHLGTWLTDKSDQDIEQRYRAIGARRTEQEVPLSELIWVIVLTKRNLMDFINDMSFPGRVADLSDKQELMQLLDKFFDEAIHAAVAGSQQVAEANAQPKMGIRKAS